MRQFRRSASVVTLMLFLAAFSADRCPAGLSLRSLKEQLANTSRSISNVQAKLRPIKRRQMAAAQDLTTAQYRLEVTRRNYRDIHSQLWNTRTKLAATRAELERIRERLKEKNDALAGRLVDTYKYGNLGYLNVILGAADFWDMLNRGYILRNILQNDVELVEAIKKDKQAVEEYEAMLEEQERKRAELERQQRGLTRVAYTQKAECRQILSDIRRDRAKYEQMLAELERTSNQIGAMIRQMQRTPEGQKRSKQVWRGKFTAPVNGRLTSAFGMRFHPILKQRRMHTGVDLAAASGTSIRAAGAGEVIYAGWYGAYGNTVIIDHGGNVQTVYAHCSSILIRRGSTVKQEQTIARVGSTGLSTGPHLHFEVRRNGVPVSPFYSR